MTCQELRLYFEDPLRYDAELRPELEHLARCPECARFVETQRELGSNLRLVRQSAPRVPASLDAAVLAVYRRHVAQPAIRSVATPRKRFVTLRWSAVTAALLIAVALLFLPSRNRVANVVPPPPERSLPEAAPLPAVQAVHALKRKAPRPVAAIQHPPSEPFAAANPLPPGFRSLMYCDELSCGEAMEVIRMQLPPSAAAFAPAAGAGGPVFADVLVGPDGIARGIRVVE